MRGLGAFLFFCLAFASADFVEHYHGSKVADKDFLMKQQQIYQLLYHIHQPNIHKEQVDIGREYTIENHYDKYTNVAAAKHFVQLYKAGFVPKGRVFSPMYQKMMHQSEALFELFYYAVDYDTFYKTACWAREYINEELFVYTFSIAVLRRHDTEGMKLPPSYEIHPYYYFPTEVIQQAYQVKMQGHHEHVGPEVTGDGKNVYINANYSGWYVHYNEEQKLSYFTEDIGWNAFYYQYNLDYPFWMNGTEFGLAKDGRGEIYYSLHRQLLARYYLERLSNGLGEIPEFDWEWPIKTGFYPSLTHFNGLEFSSRPNSYDLKHRSNLFYLTRVEDYERRIRDAIDNGYLVKPDGSHFSLTEPHSIEYLASVVESNADTPFLRRYRYPQFLAKMLLGGSVRPKSWYKIVPSALESFHTSMRDPMFYQLTKRYYRFFKQFIELLPPYTREELVFPGVKVDKVEVDKLFTYFDHFTTDINNLVFLDSEEVKAQKEKLNIKVRQERLDHVPFSVTTTISSEKAVKVSYKLFIGPKYDGFGNKIYLNENKENFFELDHFVYELKAGENVIRRNSADFEWSSKDWTPSAVQYEKVLGAIKGANEFNVDFDESFDDFPERLILPKGRRGGMPFYFFVIVVPFKEPIVPFGTGFDERYATGIGTGAMRYDGYSLDYPFDRPIDDHTYFHSTNMYFKDVVIFHKKESEINTVDKTHSTH